MAVFKCKMCGGNLDIEKGVTVYECAYCGTKQTVPSADDDMQAIVLLLNYYFAGGNIWKFYFKTNTFVIKNGRKI